MRFIDANFLTQVILKPTRENNILDLVLTNKPQYIVETIVSPTDHDLVEVVLGYNLLDPERRSHFEELDQFCFRALDYHAANFPEIQKELEEVNWNELYQLSQQETPDGSDFLELLKLTVLQITYHHSGPKDRSPGTRRSKAVREKYTLKRKRRKLNARINALKQRNPYSLNLPKLIEEVNLIAYMR